MDKLNIRQRIFVEAFLETRNATESAKRAGYSSNTAAEQASRLLTRPHIKAIIEGLAPETITRFARKTTERRGLVYVLRADNGLLKIGITIDLRLRLRRINTMLPYDVEVVYTFECQAYVALETYLHTYFATSRIRGEWFSLTSDDVVSIPSIVSHWQEQQNDT